MDFAQVLAELVRFFDEHHVRAALAGAVALQAHGLSRATGDLDFVVEETAQPELLRFLDGLGYQRLHVSAGFSNHVHPDVRRGRLDFIYLDEHTAQLIEEGARRVALFAGTAVQVPRAEHLVAMKVLAMKNDPSRTFRELADIQFLIGLPGVNVEEIRASFVRHGLEERFDDLQAHRP